MAVSKDELIKLRSLGFKSRNKKRFSFLSSKKQFVAVNIFDDGFILEFDGQKVLTDKLTLENVTTIINLLYPNEKRKRI